MRVCLVAVLCFCFTMTAAAQESNPFLVVPITDDLLQHHVIRGFFADVLRQGGLGHRKTESAAFVVLDAGGGYQCVAWPFDGRPHRQQFDGKAPEQTIAIVHTHPESSPLGSLHDQQMARRLGIPIFVVTRFNIYLVSAEGTNVALVKSRLWAPEAQNDSRCTRPR